MFVKIADFIKFKGFLVEFLENRRSWENQKPPEDRQKSGFFWASPCTMHLVCTLLIYSRTARASQIEAGRSDVSFRGIWPPRGGPWVLPQTPILSFKTRVAGSWLGIARTERRNPLHRKMAQDGTCERLGLVWLGLSVAHLCAFFWNFPDFVGDFPGWSFSSFCRLEAPTRNIPERVRDTIRIFPGKSGNPPPPFGTATPV